ncbi:MAG TPA: hypothetical protein VIC51_14035 [Psychromonas sp.]
MTTLVETRLQQHDPLVHGEFMHVASHVQRFNGECIINTLMMDGYDCPFKYGRKNKGRNLKGKQVDLSYYPSIEVIADFEMNIMKVVQIKVIAME